MFLRDLLISCLRRWYFVLIALALTSAGAYGVLTKVPPTYEASASVMLLPPTAVVKTGDNPYLYLAGLDQALGVLQVKMNSPAIAKPIEAPYSESKSEFTVSKDLGTTGPIMQIITNGNDQRDVLKLLDDVIAAMPPNLTSLQQKLDVSDASRITTMVLAQDGKATKSHKSQIQALVVVMGGGLAGAVLLIGWLDRLLLARRKRRLEAAKNTQGKLHSQSADVTPAKQATLTASDKDSARKSPRPADIGLPAERVQATVGGPGDHDGRY